MIFLSVYIKIIGQGTGPIHLHQLIAQVDFYDKFNDKNNIWIGDYRFKIIDVNILNPKP